LAQAQVVITEVMYHPADYPYPQSNNAEWIEIYNHSDEAVDLENWRLFDEYYLVSGDSEETRDENLATNRFTDAYISGGESSNPSVLLPGEVAVIIPFSRGIGNFLEAWNLPESTKIIASPWNSFENQDVPDGSYDPETNKLSNSSAQPSVIHLVDDSNNVIDIVDYYNGRFGWPSTGPVGYEEADGGSIYLRTAAILAGDPNVANDTSSNWSLSIAGVEGAYNQLEIRFGFSPDDVGTPGAIFGLVEVAIPEPASIGLFIGIAALFGLRRRR